MDSRARMMLDALNAASAPQPMQPAAQEQPMRYADGGSVGLSTLQEMANPNFDFSNTGKFAPSSFATTPFTPMMQNVPMFVADSPAYGSMGTDVYDWKAPTATAAPQPYSTVNQPAAITRNRRVPTQTAVVDVQMPGVSTPTPNVPTPEYIPTMPGTDMSPLVDPNYLNPQPPAPKEDADVYVDFFETLPDGSIVHHTRGTTVLISGPTNTGTPTTTTPGFTPVTNPLGPSPEEVRRSEAAKELELFNQRQAEEAARMAEAKRVADEAAAAQAVEDARLARLAEEKRLADKLLSDTQQQQAALAKREEERIAREAEAKRLADEQAAAVTPAPAPAPAPAPEPYFVTTNYESGAGYTVEPPGYVAPEPENTWYSGDGG